MLTLGIGLGVLVILGTAFLIFESIFSTRVNPHVSVDGIALGGISLSDAPSYLAQKEAERDLQPITLQVGSATYQVTSRQFRATYTLGPALQQAVTLGHEGDVVTRIWNQITTVVQGRDYTVTGTHDAQAVDRYLVGLNQRITVQPQSAAVGIRGNQAVVLRHPASGRRLDLPGAMRMLNGLISRRSSFSVNLPVQITVSPINGAVAQLAVDQAQALLSHPTYFSILDQIKGYELTPSQLAKLLTFHDAYDRKSRQWALALGIDRAKLRTTMAPIAAQVDRPPTGAFFTVAQTTNGDYAVPTDGIPGRVIDTDATAPLILNQGPSHTVIVPILYPQSRFDKAQALALHFDTEESKVPTLWSGSSRARVVNIKATAGQLDNIRLNPGQILSVTGVISPAVALHGGYVPDLNTIGATDVSGVNGGTVQVASALFQAAYRAGLPIVSRTQYPFLTAFDGQIGYDAMVAARPQGPDLQIANDTKHQVLILIKPDANSQLVTAYIFNSSTVGRTVQVNTPNVTINQDGSVDVTVSRQLGGDVTPGQDQISSHYQALDPYP
ncbi:MAG TPA: VanW family protein [Chloroflexota bacterium]|nr:VanW family protein [Chloroflexota bacterium]